MENRNTQAGTSFGPDDRNVATWALPEGAIARLGRGSVGDMAFSPDGQYFAVGTWIGLWLYELPTLSPIALWDTERGMTGGMTGDVNFSPDSRRIVTRTAADIKVWDIQSGTCVAQMEGLDNRSICRPVFSQDGQHLVAANYRMKSINYSMKNRKIYVWDSHTGTKVRETEIQHPYHVNPLCFSPDLSLLVGKNSDKNNLRRNNGDGDSIVVWQIETGEQIANIIRHPDRVRKFCFSPCGQLLAAGGWHGTIHVWNVESGQLEMTYTEYGESQMYPYFLPEGELIAAAVSERSVEIWHVEKGEKLDEFEHRGNKAGVGMVCFSDSGTQLALASESDIQIWTKGNNSGTHTLSTLHGHIPTMDTLVFSADEKTLAAGFWGDNVLLWDVASKHSYRPHGEKLPGTSHHVYLSASGKLLSTCRDGNLLKVWEVGKREPIVELTASEAKLMRAEAFAPTLHRLARVDTEHNIHIWECTPTAERESEDSAWKKHATLVGHTMYIKGLAFSPDGKRLVSIAAGRLETAKVPVRDARLWDVDAGEEIAQLAPKYADSKLYIGAGASIAGIAFSPLGEIVAGGHGGEIILWDATDGKVLMRIPQPRGNRRSIALRFSPCGQYLVSGAWWQTRLQKVPIRLWEVATGKNIATFWGHTTDVQCFAFSQDGTLLVSGGHDGAIYLWDLKPYL